MLHMHFHYGRAAPSTQCDSDTIDQFRGHMLLAALACAAQPAVAQGLVLTPRQTEGPLYPDQLPFDRDNDLTSYCLCVIPGDDAQQQD